MRHGNYTLCNRRSEPRRIIILHSLGQHLIKKKKKTMMTIPTSVILARDQASVFTIAIEVLEQ